MPDSIVTKKGTLIRNGQIEADTRTVFVLPDGVAPEAAELPSDEPGWMIPLPVWLAHRDTLRTRQHSVGILAETSDEAAQFADSNGHISPEGIAFIAVNFPVYTDGRGFSLAQLLRMRYKWQGELRAVGDVLIDTVHYLTRCGFNSYVLKAGHDPQKALRAITTFSTSYQRSYVATEALSVAAN